jgi:hypothetical protein
MNDDADDAVNEPPREPIEALRQDRYFAAWDNESPDERSLVEAARSLLDNKWPEAFAEMERDRAMRKLALLQVVAPYFADGAPNWESVFELLSRDDRAEVEQLLGSDSLGELLA